mmetsp:Transcript_18337/g.45690  ORF Transcript_18337/g.45690 Transcript_18337/m.45690 type:complete len:213 (-) Transcript_18337:1040-1678(-)
MNLGEGDVFNLDVAPNGGGEGGLYLPGVDHGDALERHHSLHLLFGRVLLAKKVEVHSLHFTSSLAGVLLATAHHGCHVLAILFAEQELEHDAFVNAARPFIHLALACGCAGPALCFGRRNAFQNRWYHHAHKSRALGLRTRNLGLHQVHDIGCIRIEIAFSCPHCIGAAFGSRLARRLGGSCIHRGADIYQGARHRFHHNVLHGALFHFAKQ